MAYLRSVHMPFLFQLQFTAFSALWVLISLLAGLTYAFLLYRKAEMKTALRKLLFAVRALSVALITFLFFAPFIKSADKTVEKPLIFVLQDNSASIKISQPPGFNSADYTAQLDRVIKRISSNYDVRTLSFGDSLKTGLKVNFGDKTTNINSAFSYILNRFPDRNIGAIVLASDGLYNRGGSPVYTAQNIKVPVYTIALGDTVPKKDLLIANVNYNEIVYLGNDFQIKIDVEAYQSKGINSRLSVLGKEGVLFSKVINISSAEFRQTIPLTLSAKRKGIQRYTVTIAPVDGELSKENNSQTFFVEALDGKHKIFILANSPHPDITALKQSIEINKNYEVKTGFPDAFNREDLEKSDLIILHQLPSSDFKGASLQALLKNKHIWFILGAQTDIRAFSSIQDILDISGNGSFLESFASFNNAFYDFVLSPSSLAKIKNFAPLLSPFGTYTLKTPSSILFNQQIGKLVTDKPLLVFSRNDEKQIAILCGEGLWQWRLEDFRENGSHEAVDELLSKSVQLLANKKDERRFKVYAARTTFSEGEQVVLNANLYNKSFELVNTPDVPVTLKTGNRSFPFLFSRSGNSYILEAGSLPPGEYSFQARTELGKEKFSASGLFIVSRQQAEFQQTTANHQLLYLLSDESNGKFLYPSELAKLPGLLENNELIKTITFENDHYDELINQKLIFFLILALLVLEWFSRKRNGEI